MKRIYLLSFLIVVFSCKQVKKKQDASNFILDTIPEKVDPKKLDLKKNQLFIDTTRTSKFYKRLLKWKPDKNVENLINKNLDSLENKRIIEDNLPKSFIRIRKFEDDYLFYQMCNGNIIRIEIRESLLIFYGIMEMTLKKIKLIENKEDLIIINLENKEHFSIKKIKKNNIYEVKYFRSSERLFSYLMVSNDVKTIKKYNLMVNLCTDSILPEFLKD